ncbi:hypothetical protein [Jiella mangrovi]|uniref:Uncharacterized protein n=1 Tax=Jiella mangrovi TaxID=2821407 RepID=A0ABS4BPR8_9HYPH|nr:hypothetical protein [Jiella mangrovi]MBP0618231.1 hypothetical protein [Jiella mangrovi]
MFPPENSSSCVLGEGAMTFNLSAVTAVLGGYASKEHRRELGDATEQQRRRRARRKPDDAVEDQVSSAGPDQADGPPVTGGTVAKVAGLGRALDALIAAEETRRREAPDRNEIDPASTRLSAALKTSLAHKSGPPIHDAELAAEAKSSKAAPSSDRDWDEIRDLIEALATAERPQRSEEGRKQSSAGIRLWRPKPLASKKG